METQTNKGKKKAWLFLVVAAGALLVGAGGVFAANSITINGGEGVELGQGIATVGSCEDAIKTSITQEYNATDDKFYATEVKVSEIKDFACDGKRVNVSLIGDTGSGTGVVCSVAGTTDTVDSFLIADGGTTGQDDDLTKTVTISGSCDATKITKVAITTS